jgi:hypothetical protein
LLQRLFPDFYLPLAGCSSTYLLIPESCTKYRSEAQKALCLKRSWSDFDPQAYYPYGEDQNHETGFKGKALQAVVDSWCKIQVICHNHKIAPTARSALVFCASLRILLHNLGLKKKYSSNLLKNTQESKIAINFKALMGYKKI